MRVSYAIVILFLYTAFIAQNKSADSIRNVIQQTKNNTSKINSLNSLAYYFHTINLQDSAILYANKTIELAKPISYHAALGRAYNTLGLALVETNRFDEAKKAYSEASKYFKNTSLSKTTLKEVLSNKSNLGYLNLNTGDNIEAINSFKEGLALAESIGNYKEVAEFYLSLSRAYGVQGNLAQSLKYNLNALSLFEKIGDEAGAAWSYNDIGDTYCQLGNIEQSIEYFSKSYVLAKKNKRYSTASLASYNIGDVYLKKKNYSFAMQYAQISLELSSINNDFTDKGNALLLIGKIYRERGKLENAIHYLEESIKHYNQSPTSLETYEPYAELCKIYYVKNDFTKSIFYGEQGLTVAQKLNSPLATKIATETLYKSYEKVREYTKAYKTHLLYTNTKDSLTNEDYQKEILFQDYKKQALTDSLKYETNKTLLNIENKNKLQSAQNKLILTSIVLLITIVLGGLLFQRFKITQKQKIIIESQNNSLEEKTKEIQDSILYSKEIQNTFLKSIVNNHSEFKDALLIYKPKDIVSGDFYWYKEVGDNLYVVVGDCSGHGVPGAIISVLAIQSLEKIINSISPEELHQLSPLLKQEFDVYYKQESHVSIGLDYSVICLNHKSKSLFLSGSGSTILLKSKTNQIIAEQFDSLNIGGSTPLTYRPNTARYSFDELRSVFLYTDGVVDQRGGDKNKKFGTAQLKHLLENLNTKDTPETLAKIELAFNNWKGANKQMDDITLLGLQINA